MNDTTILLAMEAIRNLKAAYFRCMDTKNWTEFGTLFTADATFDVRGALEMPRTEEDYASQPIIEGVSAITSMVRSGLTPLISVHHGHCPEITILSDASANAVWPMTDLLVFPDGGPLKMFRGYGYYHETYSRREDRWQIATLKLRRLYVERS
jgi:hypothetical protein